MGILKLTKNWVLKVVECKILKISPNKNSIKFTIREIFQFLESNESTVKCTKEKIFEF